MIHQTDDKAELALVGATYHLCFAKPAEVAEVFAAVTPSDFFHESNQITFGVLCDMWRASQKIDGTTLSAELRRRGVYDEIGGRDYLVDMLDAGNVGNALEYACIVRDFAARRRIAALCNGGMALAEDPQGKNATEIAGGLSRELAQVGSDAAAARYVTGQKLSELCWAEQNERDQSRSVLTGFADFPLMKMGRFYIVAGRPSMGKSAWAKALIAGMLQRGIPVGMAVPDETKTKVGNDFAASIAKLSVSDVDAKRLQDAENTRFAEALGKIAAWPVYVDDEITSIEDLEAVGTLWKARHGIKVLYVDYLSLLGTKEREASTTTSRVTVIAKRLKALFRRLDVVGIAISQLSRANAARPDKRPNLTDLRESGELEQAADAVLALHRESYYQHEEGNQTGEEDYTEVWVLKDKTGARMRGFVMRSIFSQMRFLPMVHEEQTRYWRMMKGEAVVP